MPKLTPPVNKADHIQGMLGSPIELVEYGDYECPHCGAAYPVTKELINTYGDDMAFVFRHFPLMQIHPMAFPAALAAEAAGRQRQFWGMHDLIFENQSQLNENALLELARSLHLNMTVFRQDLQDPELGEKIESHFESGVRSGVNGTPSFFINGVRYNGSYDYNSLAGTIEMIVNKTY